MKKNIFISIIFIAIHILTISLLHSQQPNETKLLRFPNTSKTEVTFAHGGNIYVAPITGGVAQKITSSIGIELMPRFSPDGQNIAFIGEYDGNQEIYLTSRLGGEPKRITYSMDQPNIADRQGPDKIIMQWSNDGKQIIYRSRMLTWNVLTGQLFRTNVDASGLPTQISVPKSGYAYFNSDENKIVYNRIFREYRTWKHYRGGQADDIWIYDLITKELTNLTNNPAQDIIPMWYNDKIYFLSDRDYTMNLFCYDLTTKQTKKITDFKEFDVKFPSLGPEHIAFENGGVIYLMNLTDEKYTPLNIIVVDDEVTARTELKNVSKNANNDFSIAPDANRGVFSARGEIFVVPSSIPDEQSTIKNLTNTSGINERNVAWSPDGKWIAYISDKTGTDEIWTMRPDGSTATQLTENSSAYRYELRWSPDGKKLLNSDNARNFTIIDVAAKTEKTIFHSKTYSIRDIAWSPDNKWIAYSDVNPQQMEVIYLYNIAQDKHYQITSDFFNSRQMIFSKDGKYLFFVSDRDFVPNINSLEWNFSYSDMAKIYAVCLRKDISSPFLKFIDYNNPPKEEPKLSKKEKEILDTAAIIVDLDNISNRIFTLPIPVANYYNLHSIENKLYYNRFDKLYFYDFKDMKEKEAGNTNHYDITLDGKNIMFKNGDDFYINKLTDKINTNAGKLDLTEMKMYLNHKEEWTQVFNESWRHYKQFFYAPNMHGVDWNLMRERYASLVPYVTHRTDLTYLIGEMIGELNAGHCYVTGGEMPNITEVGIGLLGIDLELEQSTKYYKITKVLEGQNWDNELRSPLTEPGLGVRAGGYIIAIDDNVLTPEVNPYSFLVGKANKIVKLTISDKPNKESSHDIFIKTIDNEAELRYYNWVEERRHIVDSVSNGKIGYVHIPDMGVTHGLNWFAKYFYPQVRKEGMIIDDRYNGGGNVSPMIIERLRRELTMAKIGRNSETVFTIPSAVMTGPIVCLINEQSMSDGDMFPFQFKADNIGPIIGKRSWGGVVGIYGSLPLLDGSSINKPEVANFGAESRNWELEGVGMIPDFEIDNHPDKEYNGIDEQLLFGIEKVFELMKTNKKKQIPPIPQYPIKNK